MDKTSPASKRLIEKLSDKLRHHAYYMLGDLQDAEDVVQDAFMKMFDHKGTGPAVMNREAYLWRMVSNACVDVIRRRKNGKTVTIESHEASGAVSAENRETSIIRNEEFVRINRLLSSIPFDQAEVLRFRFVDGLTFPEIAAILEVPLTTVKSRFTYGMDKVRTQFFNQKEVTHAM